MRSEKQILESIEVIGRTMCEIDEEMRLMLPLVEMLLPKAKEATMAGVPLEGRTIMISKLHFPEQSKKGINRAMGFDIIWV